MGRIIHHKAAPQSARENRARAHKTKQIDESPSLLSRVWSQCRNSLKSPRIMKRTTQTRPSSSQSRTKKVAFASGAVIIPPGPPPVPARAPTRPAQTSACPEVVLEAAKFPRQSYFLGVLDMTFIVQNLIGL
ncbi:hypothetical protein DTO166G4_4696 [Paecilomyces variotii]|nr:hypothetical protein DTO032I3_9172 [Paecilomyces variotii]KAJ9192884.1 hypothetical protein DTO164E3_8117 [Paecilomyces variotii]KAJ9213765.1 hypothetical protein DTO166G4_4696 [Paecilomyces variotii]KAJ9226594.1 hypothetical protein DTO169C6_834 [Paecilomyces variotii]KAJ9230230.1 hypothetical protein DTO169E5_8539 [Paecilomyces variotii]